MLVDEDLAEKLVESSDPSAKRWLFDLQESLALSPFIKLVVTLCVIWTSRRKAIHESIF